MLCLYVLCTNAGFGDFASFQAAGGPPPVQQQQQQQQQQQSLLMGGPAMQTQQPSFADFGSFQASGATSQVLYMYIDESSDISNEELNVMWQ